MRRILVIEDDADIRDMLQYSFSRESYEVNTASNGQDGLELALSSLPDIIVLDLMLPRLNGLEVCKKLKENPRTKAVPIIMLTAKGDETDVVLGLGLGADDYVTKPFSIRELNARVSARLRPGTAAPSTPVSDEKIRYAGVEVDSERFEIRIESELLPLTLAEFRLFRSLINRPGIVQTRERLLDVLTGGDTVVIDRNIDVHVRSIRKKLGDRRDFIQTVRGVGYRFREN